MTTSAALVDVPDAASIRELVDALDREELRDLVVELTSLLAAPTAVAQDLDDFGPEAVCRSAIALSAVAFGVTPEAVLSRSRSRNIADARAVAHMVARNCSLSLPVIGAQFHQHHTTVMYSVEKVASTPRLQVAATRITDQVLDVLAHPSAA